MDWLRNGPPPPGGGYGHSSYNSQPPSSSPRTDTTSGTPTSSHRSPDQFRSFIARYSDAGAPVPQPVRPKSAGPVPNEPAQLDSKTLPIAPPFYSQPNAEHPMTSGIKISSSPLLLTPPPSSDHDENLSPISPVTLQSSTDSNASIKLPVLPCIPCPRIPSPSSFERLMEAEYGKQTIYGVTPDMLSDWQTRYPFVRESDHINYQYDASTSRMIIRCTPSPVHDSLQIYFQGRVSGVLTSRLGVDKFMENIQMSCGSGILISTLLSLISLTNW